MHFEKAFEKYRERVINSTEAELESIISSSFEAAYQRDIFKIISDNVDNTLYVNDINTHELLFANKTLAGSVGKTPEELIGKTCWQVLREDQEDVCLFCPVKKLIDKNGNKISDTYTWEFQNTINGKWYLVKNSIIEWIDGRKVHIENAIDITRQKQYEEVLRHSASYDEMTGVYKREWGYKVIQGVLSSSFLSSKDVFSLVFIDLDGLKKVNDTYGHEAGDNMIISVVASIRSCVRQSDVICRWGGDEFLILLKCDIKSARGIMKKINRKLKDVNNTSGEPYDLSFSHGIKEINAYKHPHIDDIIAAADRLMYKNKMKKKGLTKTPEIG